MARVTKLALEQKLSELATENTNLRGMISKLNFEIAQLKEAKQASSTQRLEADRAKQRRALSPERQAEVDARRAAMEAAKAAAIAGKSTQVVRFS